MYDRYVLSLKQRLSARRFHHSLGTMLMATCLARKWRADEEKASVAGLLHDCARELPRVRERTFLEGLGIEVSSEDETFPQIWHALAAGVIVERDFAVNDAEIKRAIMLHPTGEQAMTLLEKVLFLADYLEPTRRFEGIEELRKLVFENLEAGLAHAIEAKTDFVVRKRNYQLHPRARRALQCYTTKEETLKYVTQR